MALFGPRGSCNYIGSPFTRAVQSRSDTTTATTRKTARTMAIPIHSGLVTNHQDQLMTWVSFNTRKIRNKTVGSPTPPDALALTQVSTGETALLCKVCGVRAGA